MIADCIDTVSPLEREVQDRQGRWYSLRIRPYKNVDNKIDGAVLALFDVDAPKRSEDRVRLAAGFAESILEMASQPMAVQSRVANDGYIPGRVNFSMRTKLDVNIVELLRSIPLPGAEGEFGFGHPAASGGSLAPRDFTRLLAALGFAAA